MGIFKLFSSTVSAQSLMNSRNKAVSVLVKAKNQLSKINKQIEDGIKFNENAVIKHNAELDSLRKLKESNVNQIKKFDELIVK